MIPHGWLLIAIFVLLVGATIRPLGGYMAWVFSGRCTSNRFLGLFERAFLRLACVDPSSEQNWFNYAIALLLFNLAGMIFLFGILLLQGSLPLNPQGFGALAPDLAFNTAVSFVTNTSWQAYAGETTLSYFSQMAGITAQSFLSAATGMAVAIAMVRGFARHGGDTIGNAWVDLTRATLYVLLPICVIGALFFASQGVPQTLADPFENPTALTNLFEMLLIFLIGTALTNTFGRMVGDERQGWSLLGAMMVLFAMGLCVVYSGEASGNPHFAKLGIDQAVGPLQAGGNMEGKEVRFGIAGSALFANVTTASADGAVNSMHDSFSPLGGGMVMANMMLDEVIVGAPGSGLFGMLLFALIAVFVAAPGPDGLDPRPSRPHPWRSVHNLDWQSAPERPAGNSVQGLDGACRHGGRICRRTG
jgi:K+-transporting ATPase ATPase A chain